VKAFDYAVEIKILGASPEVFEIRNPRFEIYQRSKLRGIHHPERNKSTQVWQQYLFLFTAISCKFNHREQEHEDI
jgi:hypothetical protein